MNLTHTVKAAWLVQCASSGVAATASTVLPNSENNSFTCIRADVRAVLMSWLLAIAPKLDLNNVLAAAHLSLTAGCKIKHIECPHCKSYHLDALEHAVNLHKWHCCLECGKTWSLDAHVQGNPITGLGAALQPDGSLAVQRLPA